jgi:hypothetical protein
MDRTSLKIGCWRRTLTLFPKTTEQTDRPAAQSSAVARALWVNAALLGAILLVLVVRSGTGRVPEFLPAAYGQNTPPIAGGAGVFIMPAQLSQNTWGVYLLDVDAQTIAAYSYLPGPRQLQLMAARTYRWDRRLQNFNTAAPSPDEVKQLLDREAPRPVSTPPPASPSNPAPAGSNPAGNP